MARPARYERTSAPFWDDPYIASQMLTTHLDPATDLASRNPAFMDRSARWLASQLAPGAALLDLGCGPGLYGKRFSDLGLRVSGLDISAGSVDYARTLDPAGHYSVGSYLELDAVASWDAATLIYCDYGALTDIERHELLGRVRRALRPGGRLILDVFTPAWLAAQPVHATWQWCEQAGFFTPEPHLYLAQSLRYDGGVGLDRHLVVTQGRVEAYHVWNTVFTPSGLCEELAAGGFGEVEFNGDIAGLPTTEGSATLCAIATATV